MFRLDQILTATTFIRSFKEVAQWLSLNPKPLPITKRDGGFIVIVDGGFFEGRMSARSQFQCMPDASENSGQSVFKT